MRRTARQHAPVITAYEKMLDGRVQRGEISRQTKHIAIGHAHRLFEVCLHSLAPEALEAMVKVWFPGSGGYTKVIRDLHQLVSERERRARKPKR